MRSTLHNLDRFQKKLAELEGSLQLKIQTYTQELDDFEHRSKQLTTVKEAQKLYEELLKSSSRYAQSEAANRYEAISTNIRLLIELLRISEAESIKSLQAYEAQAEKLSQWQESVETLSPFLRERFDSVYEATEKTKAQLLQRQQADAERWVKALVSQAAELDRLTDAAEKGKLANKLLQKIQREQAQHSESLSAAHQDSLKEIEQRCETEIDQDRENQIKLLFQQLPRVQRFNLYRQLEVYLLDPTEEFNG
jgi:hypothetical protein